MKILALLCGIGFLPFASFSQVYSIDWHKIAGGGGVSSGGNFSLIGTIGQHDAGTMTGGSYTLEGGFLSGIVLVQTPGAPLLIIQLSGANAVISWPVTGSDGFILQEASNLNSASWGNSAATVNTSGDVKSVTIPAAGLKFYRLIKPQTP